MIEINTNKFKSRPFQHQIEGIKCLVKNKAFALFDEMGAGKSKQVVDAACILAEAGEIDTVVILAPASVRSVWINPEIGEIKKHAWVASVVEEYHSKMRRVWSSEGWTKAEIDIRWVVTNYEFLRRENRLQYMINFLASSKVMLVLDESSYVKNRNAQQAKAVYKLRQHCARCVLLNGTPVTDNPLDLWAQFRILDERILFSRYKNYYHFRAHYAVMGGWKMKQVVKWINLKNLSAILKPWVLRRLKKDCLDLPEKMFTLREVPLGAETWQKYQELKRDAVMSLGEGEQLLEPNAAVRVMRLAQVTSGHIGSTQVVNEYERINPERGPTEIVQDLSSEKLDWCVKYLTEECQARYVIVWCRWRRERERLAEILKKVWKDGFVYQLYGGQKNSEREEAVEIFSGGSVEQTKLMNNIGIKRQFLLAQPHAGGFGLNLVAATEVIYLSNDWSLGIRLQSEDRCHRPGQKHPVTYIDVLATGPKGQKTIDHTVYKALINKQELARLTTSAWRAKLEEDEW